MARRLTPQDKRRILNTMLRDLPRRRTMVEIAEEHGVGQATISRYKRDLCMTFGRDLFDVDWNEPTRAALTPAPTPEPEPVQAPAPEPRREPEHELAQELEADRELLEAAMRDVRPEPVSAPIPEQGERRHPIKADLVDLQRLVGYDTDRPTNGRVGRDTHGHGLTEGTVVHDVIIETRGEHGDPLARIDGLVCFLRNADDYQPGDVVPAVRIVIARDRYVVGAPTQRDA